MLYIKDLKKGETYFECDYGICIEFVAIEEPQLVDDARWVVKCKTEGGAITELMCSVDHPHNGPKIYDYHAYTGREDF